MDRKIPPIDLGDIIRLRKPHPCGSYSWRIVRLGVDIGLVCCQCGRRVTIPRSQFNKQFKRFESRAQDQGSA